MAFLAWQFKKQRCKADGTMSVSSWKEPRQRCQVRSYDDTKDTMVSVKNLKSKLSSTYWMCVGGDGDLDRVDTK